MESLKLTAGVGLVAFLGTLGYNVGDKIDQRNIDYLITVGGILLAFVVIVAAIIFYCVLRARQRAHMIAEFGVDGFGNAPSARRSARGDGFGYPQMLGGPASQQGWGQQYMDGPPRLTMPQDNRGSFAMDAPVGSYEWGQQ